MPPISWPTFESYSEEAAQHKARTRPLPLRVRTFSQSKSRSPEFEHTREGAHLRNGFTSNTIDNAQLSPQTPRVLASMLEEDEELEEEAHIDSSPRSSLDGLSDLSTLAGSPETPLTSLSSQRSSLDAPPPDTIPFDFSRIDYELEKAKVLGHGLWSTVYLAEQKAIHRSSPTPSPRRLRLSLRKSRASSVPVLFAVKTPARRDAKDIFLQEARILSRLQYRSGSRLYTVPFYGFDERHDSLVFEAVIGGSLEELSSRMKQMTEVARHLELISLFPGIALDLIGGLEFLHNNGIVHADIKPGNVLLDMSQHTEHQRPVVRARYIDFSAAFMPEKGDSTSNAGGTWDYMAPEQMRVQKDLSMPTFASDVWSLGITLLYVMTGGSPYTAACGGNSFMLREAIKCGDPIGFARNEPVERKRLAACQDFLDCCRLALKKDRENRITAKSWMTWLEECEWDAPI